jgi:hypothetical protein
MEVLSMQTYYFQKRVEADGSVNLSDLPPNAQVEIVVVNLDPTDVRAEMQAWMAEVRAHHPFARMSKAEILKALRQTREQVWKERHEN